MFPSPPTPPENVDAAFELPPTVKHNPGLDAERSLVVLPENNLFNWPSFDPRRVGDRDDRSVAYGFLPPRLFTELRRRIYLSTEPVP